MSFRAWTCWEYIGEIHQDHRYCFACESARDDIFHFSFIFTLISVFCLLKLLIFFSSSSLVLVYVSHFWKYIQPEERRKGSLNAQCMQLNHNYKKKCITSEKSKSSHEIWILYEFYNGVIVRCCIFYEWEIFSCTSVISVWNKPLKTFNEQWWSFQFQIVTWCSDHQVGKLRRIRSSS